jgi:hypothetical protein
MSSTNDDTKIGLRARDDDLLDRTMKLWKREKSLRSAESKGKSIYAAIKIDKLVR